MIIPEEIVESAILANLRERTDIECAGVLEPALDGEMKLHSDTYIGVGVDIDQQTSDHFTKLEMTATVTLRVMFADDKGGSLFRAAHAAVMGMILDYSDVNCETMDTDQLRIDAFRLSGTSHSLDTSVDGGAIVKTWTISVVGYVQSIGE